ncbi:MAG: multidrug efflux system membrane fusion protein [Candidatus Azotimanducaceae bacterium]|jgi:multidrug efflux system membrane fusion protein
MPEGDVLSNKNLIAVFIAFVMAVWLFSGELTSNIAIADEASSSSDVAEITHVRARESAAELRQLNLSVSGQTKANRIVAVKAEISGRIVEIPGLRGTHVKAGDLLCKIAVDSRLTDFNQARAELKSAKLEFDGIEDLNKRGLQSDINVAKAEAALAASRASAKRAELSLSKTNLVAPFDGVVESQSVEIGDYLNVGQQCVSLLEIDPILVVGQVAEKSIGHIVQGGLVDVKLITGEAFQGLVSFIARAPNTVTRTYTVEVTVKDPGEHIRAGLTAEMFVPMGKQSAHLISSASLVLDDDGVMGVRIVDANNIVHFKKVSILSEDVRGVWVDGLPNNVNIITVGHEEVFKGQTVKIDLSPLGSFVAS